MEHPHSAADYPTIECQLEPGRRQVSFFCEHCRRKHYHGNAFHATEPGAHIGHRTAHCDSNRASRYSSYDLVLGQPTPPDLATLERVFVHVLEHGAIMQQGQVIAVKGSRVLVQLFSWRVPGKLGDAVWFTKAFLRSKKCRLYTDENVWRSTGDAESRTAGRLGTA
jgi:hypothetical protein